MPKPIAAQGAYPTLTDLTCDPCAARILSAAYATSAGELNASLQYIYHSINFLCANDEHTADVLKGIAISEMHHLHLLGEALIRLGAAPVYSFQPPMLFNFYSTKFVSYSRTLSNMIEDDIVGEKYAICTYEKMLPRLKSVTLRTLICRILEDEHLHLKVLTEIQGGM